MATTIKLPADLKARVASVAKRKGKSAHAFMLDAIEQQTSREERRQDFVADALSARAEVAEVGKGYPAAEVHRYLDARVRGEKAPKPRAKSWRK